MNWGRRILLAGITTLVLASQLVQLITYENKIFLLYGIGALFVLSFIFIDDVLSLLKMNKK